MCARVCQGKQYGPEKTPSQNPLKSSSKQQALPRSVVVPLATTPSAPLPLRLPLAYGHVVLTPDVAEGEGLRELPADAKVAQLDLASGVDQNVRRLDICVRHGVVISESWLGQQRARTLGLPGAWPYLGASHSARPACTTAL